MSTLENQTTEAPIVVVAPEAATEAEVFVRINAETAEAVDAFYRVLQATYDQIKIRTNSPLNHVSHPDSSTAIDVTVQNGEWDDINQLATQNNVTAEPWPSNEADQKLIDG